MELSFYTKPYNLLTKINNLFNISTPQPINILFLYIIVPHLYRFI